MAAGLVASFSGAWPSRAALPNGRASGAARDGLAEGRGLTGHFLWWVPERLPWGSRRLPGMAAVGWVGIPVRVMISGRYSLERR